MFERQTTTRVRKLTDKESEPDLKHTTPAERIEMVWPLTVDVWSFKGEADVESRLPRHVVRVLRRES